MQIHINTICLFSHYPNIFGHVYTYVWMCICIYSLCCIYTINVTGVFTTTFMTKLFFWTQKNSNSLLKFVKKAAENPQKIAFKNWISVKKACKLRKHKEHSFLG